MDPIKDLSGVADLIEEAFADDLDRSGQSALQELRWLSRLKPILWWMVLFSSDYNDFLSGFVWEEDSKIVGNITVNRSAPGSRRWLISNLAVSENYRGRGIARGLMYAGLELVKEYDGVSVSLQVRADNAPAKHLYESLHFKEISGTVYLRTKSVPKVGPLHKLPSLPRNVMLRPRNFDTLDARQAYQLASAAMPVSVQKEWPLRQGRFRLTNQEHVNNFFRQFVGGGSSAHWVVEDGQRFVGTLSIQPGTLGKTHQIELMVHPDWRGYLESPLLSRALHYLYAWRNRGISIKHPLDHVEAIEAYQELGFQEVQTLLWMKQEM